MGAPQEVRDEIGARMVWPVLKTFLASDETLSSWAEKAAMKPRRIEAIVANPTLGKLSEIAIMAWALGVELRMDLKPLEARSHMRS
jgi:hypothetical protein